MLQFSNEMKHAVVEIPYAPNAFSLAFASNYI